MGRNGKDELNAKALRLLKKLIASGKMQRPDTCELCGKSPGYFQVKMPDKILTRPGIVAHHWRGYSDDALTDVWWICNDCNIRLKGDRFHNGTLDRDQVRAYLKIQP